MRRKPGNTKLRAWLRFFDWAPLVLIPLTAMIGAPFAFLAFGGYGVVLFALFWLFWLSPKIIEFFDY